MSEAVVSHVLCIWFNSLNFQLSEIDIWPTRKATNDHMPDNSGKVSPMTHVILQKFLFKNLHLQALRENFLLYKNALKAMVGCTASGTVSYISDEYGDSASDCQIIEERTI